MECRSKKVRLASACSTVDMSFGVDVERGDAALVVGNRGGHARQACGKCHHGALADKLVREFVQISLDLRRIWIESGFRLHRGRPYPHIRIGRCAFLRFRSVGIETLKMPEG